VIPGRAGTPGAIKRAFLIKEQSQPGCSHPDSQAGNPSSATTESHWFLPSLNNAEFRFFRRATIQRLQGLETRPFLGCDFEEEAGGHQMNPLSPAFSDSRFSPRQHPPKHFWTARLVVFCCAQRVEQPKHVRLQSNANERPNFWGSFFSLFLGVFLGCSSFHVITS
jgi:hypothetical protein